MPGCMRAGVAHSHGQAFAQSGTSGGRGRLAAPARFTFHVSFPPLLRALPGPLQFLKDGINNRTDEYGERFLPFCGAGAAVEIHPGRS